MIPLRGILYAVAADSCTNSKTETLACNPLLMHPVAINALLALQTFIVLFLAFHDWIPLGKLNNPAAVRAANPGAKLFTTTLLSAAPYVFGLAASVLYFGKPYPDWLFLWLWISYVLLFLV